MLKYSKSTVTFLFILMFGITQAQLRINRFDKTLWEIGLGFNIVDDNNHQYTKLLDVKDSWNMVPYPSRLSVAKIFNHGLSAELILSYNRYHNGNIIQGKIANYNRNYFSTDLNAKYDLNELFGDTKWFDPSLSLGFGYTYIGADLKNNDNVLKNVSQKIVTFNTGIGCNFWVTNQLAITTQALAKWNISNKLGNHTQYALGIIFKFSSLDIKLTKKTKENKIRKNINDVNVVKKNPIDSVVKTEKDIVTPIDSSQEKLDLTAKHEIATKKANMIAEEVLFELSYITLDSNGLKKLDEIAELIKSNPNMKVNIIGHTCSSGSKEFNDILSEKRARYVREELEKRGVNPLNFNKCIGKGPDTPLFDNSSINQAKNRTIRFELVD